MAQDNQVKSPVYMPTPENTAGNESGATNLIPGTGESAPMQNPSYINIEASGENLSAKYKNPQVKQDVPAAGQDQYC